MMTLEELLLQAMQDALLIAVLVLAIFGALAARSYAPGKPVLHDWADRVHIASYEHPR